MPIKFHPHYQITPSIAKSLMRIEAAKEKAAHCPVTPTVLASLRETARLYTTHYSTMIEGNRLAPSQIETVLKHKGHFPGRERDEHEVRGYYTALNQIEQWAKKNTALTESVIQKIHALVMSNGRLKVKPTPYRDGQNVIRDGETQAIIYLPPEAKDVPTLMAQLLNWIDQSKHLPHPILAGIAHYQFATIHPYYDGNGRTARLLTNFILHLGDYDLKGLYSLEEYYARRLSDYYTAISIGESHNYYMGRAEADITPWLEYFIAGMAISFENVLKHLKAEKQKGSTDHSSLLRTLDARQRKALTLFSKFECINSKQLCELFGLKERSGSQLCAHWVQDGFLKPTTNAKKSRKYQLTEKYASTLQERSCMI